jgi:hypothetical protein
MSDPKKYTEKTEVKTETKRDSDATGGEYEEETTVKTEGSVEEEKEPVIIVEEN